VNLRRRIAALEKRLIVEPVLLVMPDGSTASIPGRCDLLNLLVVAARGVDISPEQAERLDLIRRSTSAIQPDGGRLVELIRCCVLGPGVRQAEEPAEG
jgi:hypothetical protein